jgi:GTP cyclohydrolase II
VDVVGVVAWRLASSSAQAVTSSEHVTPASATPVTSRPAHAHPGSNESTAVLAFPSATAHVSTVAEPRQTSATTVIRTSNFKAWLQRHASARSGRTAPTQAHESRQNLVSAEMASTGKSISASHATPAALRVQSDCTSSVIPASRGCSCRWTFQSAWTTVQLERKRAPGFASGPLLLLPISTSTTV